MAIESNMNMHPQAKIGTLSGWLANVGQVARTFAGMFKRADVSPAEDSGLRAQDPYPWIKSYPPQVEWAADIPVKPLYALLDDAAQLHAANPCVEFRGRHFSFAEIQLLRARAAKGLADAGFQPGMKLGLFLPNFP